MLQQPLTIGSLPRPNRLMLAPLAGVTDVPFRRLCVECGAGLTFVEMLASNAVLAGNRRTLRTMSRHGDEHVLAVQVTGPDEDQLAGAVAKLDAEGFDLIDLNMGCPVKKVVSKGWGSALLADPERVHRMLRRTRAATAKPLSVKIRLGMDRERVVVEEVAAAAAESGADMLTIHGRTRDETYDIPVDYAAISTGITAARKVAPHPMVLAGNGDILDVHAAHRMVRNTGCDAVMISRGALGNPWIFREILEDAPFSTTLSTWREGVLRHLAYHEEFYGSGLRAAVLARKHLAWYARGFPGIRDTRMVLSQIGSLAEAREVVDTFSDSLDPTTLRYLNGQTEADDPGPGLRDPKQAMDRDSDRAAAEEGYDGDP